MKIEVVSLCFPSAFSEIPTKTIRFFANLYLVWTARYVMQLLVSSFQKPVGCFKGTKWPNRTYYYYVWFFAPKRPPLTDPWDWFIYQHFCSLGGMICFWYITQTLNVWYIYQYIPWKINGIHGHVNMPFFQMGSVMAYVTVDVDQGIRAHGWSTYPPRNQGLIAGLIMGNQWLIRV